MLCLIQLLIILCFSNDKIRSHRRDTKIRGLVILQSFHLSRLCFRERFLENVDLCLRGCLTCLMIMLMTLTALGLYGYVGADAEGGDV